MVSLRKHTFRSGDDAAWRLVSPKGRPPPRLINPFLSVIFGDKVQVEQESELKTRIMSGVTLPNIFACWLSTGQHARIIFDANLHIIWANTQFLASVDDYGFLSVDRGSFRFIRKKDHSKLEEMIADRKIQDGFFIGAEMESVQKFAIQIQRISCDQAVDYFGIRIARYENYLSSNFRNFQGVYNFTNTENEICHLLLSGKNVWEISEEKRKSQDTIRFHIRNIYTKMNISSREEFFANLRHFLFS